MQDAAGQPKRSIVKHERIAITKRTLDALAAPTRDVVLWDKTLRSFGLRLSPSGAITFLVQYRNAQGRSRRITIGPYGPYTPDKARKEAERLLSEAKAARNGWSDAKDPAERRREERTAITFRQLSVEYMEKAEQGLILSNRTGRAKKSGTVTIDKYRMTHLVRHFGDKLVKNVDRGDCQRCLEMLIAGKHGAGRTYGLLGGVFTYAVGQGYITANPARGVPTPRDRRRKFKLDPSGYRALGKALEAAEARCEPWQAVGAIWLIALVGLRKNEAQRLALREIDLAGHCLRYGDTKAGEDMPQNVRPLGEPAIVLLDKLMRRGGRPESPWLFPGRNPKKPFNGLGDSKNGCWTRIVGTAYSPHFLRHAFGSACHAVGLSDLTRDYLMGHAAARTESTGRGYVSPLDDVLLAAADKVSGYIWEAMTREPAKAGGDADVIKEVAVDPEITVGTFAEEDSK
jgi:integrase